MVNEQSAKEELVFGFESESQRKDFSRVFGIALEILPPVGAPKPVEGRGPAEQPKLTDEEWDVVRELLPPPEKCQSRVPERAFIDACLLAARLNFRWSLMRVDPACESVRKKLTRFSLANRWIEIFEGVKGKVEPTTEKLFAILAARGHAERERIYRYRDARLADALRNTRS